jgi:hypothetical protein
MHTIQLFLLWNAATFIGIYAIDCILICLNKKGRWFQLHALVNYAIAGASMSDVMLCIADHSVSNTPIGGRVAGSLAFSLHLYHCCRFKLRQEDWSHHIVSVFICAPLCVANQTKALSLYYFFCTGLPGAIDYSALTLLKNGKILRRHQKKVCSWLNTYIRMPGGIICASLMLKDSLLLPVPINYTLAVLSLLVYGNATYYGKQAIENYAALVGATRRWNKREHLA